MAGSTLNIYQLQSAMERQTPQLQRTVSQTYKFLESRRRCCEDASSSASSCDVLVATVGTSAYRVHLRLPGLAREPNSPLVQNNPEPPAWRKKECLTGLKRLNSRMCLKWNHNTLCMCEAVSGGTLPLWHGYRVQSTDGTANSGRWIHPCNPCDAAGLPGQAKFMRERVD